MKLQDEYGDKGLHLFAFEVQGASADAIKKLLTPKGVNYPVASGMPKGYTGVQGIPHVWLIGVDGKVIFCGFPGQGNFKTLLKDELAKVKYPGLGLSSIDPALEESAKLFGEQKFGKARDAANAALQTATAGSDAAKQAAHIVEKIKAKADKLTAAAEKHVADKAYFKAIDAFDAIKVAFEGADEAKAVDARLAELKKDETAGKEITAAIEFRELEAKAKDMSTEEKRKAMDDFAKKHEGTKASERAAKLASPGEAKDF
ncbi:MAG: hypothetical protein HUU29_06955 [Planctomycetaceae bacterium]|nr:hypothetical protein [Planctomycetaceae bacterium]